MTSPALAIDTSGLENLEALYVQARGLNLTPGWLPREEPILRPEPKTEFVPAHWRYDECRAALDAAGRLIDVRLAERRNLLLRNPFPANNFSTTRTLVCAYQMILPGERARSHRHSSHALRIILDAQGSYSVVNGERMPMESGDVVLTPGWYWHSHGHDGDQPAYWVDALDVPLTHLLQPLFFEEHPAEFEKVIAVKEVSPFRFSASSIEAALDKQAPDPEGFLGRAVPLDTSSMPTVGLRAQRLETGAATRPHKVTASRVYTVLSGAGSAQVGEHTYRWSRGDTFVVPAWTLSSISAASDAVLICISDEPLMRFAGYYRLAQ